ncbi:hypothetical protein SAVIM40S_00890 [Streptomyces avidinii]
MRPVRGLRVALGGGLHEAGAVHVVLVVEEGAAAVDPAGGRVLRAYRRRPVRLEHARDGRHGLVLGVRERVLDRGSGGQLGAQSGYAAVPQAAQAVRVVPGDAAGLAQLHPDQVDLGPGDQDVHFGAAAPGGGYGLPLPGARAVPGGHLRVGGAYAVLPGLRVGGAVRGSGGVLQVRAVGLVPAVGLSGGQVDGGDLDARRYGTAQVGVHEEEVVVGVGDDLQGGALGHTRAEHHLGGRRLPLGPGPLSVGPGRHAGDADGEHGKQGRESGAAGQGHVRRLRGGRSGAGIPPGRSSRCPDGSSASGDDRGRLCPARLWLTHHQVVFDWKASCAGNTE